MRNRHPQLCSICQGTVPAGEGSLRREGSGWSVTHVEACPRGIQDHGSIRHGHARAYARRAMTLLACREPRPCDIDEAVESIAALVRTQWTSMEAAERILLNSKALSSMDRLEVEGVLSQLRLVEESRT